MESVREFSLGLRKVFLSSLNYFCLCCFGLVVVFVCLGLGDLFLLGLLLLLLFGDNCCFFIERKVDFGASAISCLHFSFVGTFQKKFLKLCKDYP